MKFFQKIAYVTCVDWTSVACEVELLGSKFHNNGFCYSFSFFSLTISSRNEFYRSIPPHFNCLMEIINLLAALQQEGKKYSPVLFVILSLM